MIKKLLSPLLLGCLALGVASCSEDFDIAAPYKNVTVVYGLLNKADSAHYIRIQKAFLDENLSAVSMAGTSDSNFYASLDVKMQELNGTTVMNEQSLDRVQVPKDTGVFFDSPQFCYKYVRNLNPSYTYKLVIFNPATNATITGTSAVIDTSSTTFRIADFNLAQYALRFPNRNPTDVFRLQVQAPANFEPGERKYLEGNMRFNYREKDAASGTITRKFVDWTFATISASTATSSFINLEVSQASFYSTLRNGIKVAPAGITRVMDSVDMTIWMAGAGYDRYVTVNNLKGGLTEGQIRPVYSNLQGADVFGVYSTRAKRVRNSVPIDPITKDSLRQNATTRELNIVSQF